MEGFPQQTVRSKRLLRNALVGTDSFLANAADDQIVSWEWRAASNQYIKGLVASTQD